MRLLLRILPLFFCLPACTTIRVASLNAHYPPKEGLCDAAILSIPPSETFDEVAIVDLSGWTTNVGEYAELLRAKVCELGGDAAVVAPLGSTSQLMYNGSYYSTYTTGHGQAAIIRFKSGEQKRDAASSKVEKRRKKIIGD